MLRLHVIPARGGAFDRVLEGGSIVIGRAPSSDLVLEDRFLSRIHARLWVEADQVMLEDLGSHNGTFLNGVRVSSPVPVHPGDSIRVSTSVIKLGLADETLDPDRTLEPPIAGATLVRDASDLLPDSRRAPAPSDSPEELVRYSERLALLHEIHKALAGTGDLAGLLELILDRLFDHFRPEQAAVFLRREDGRLTKEAERIADGSDLGLDFRSLEHEVGDKGLALVVLDALQDERFSGSDSIMASGVRSMMAAPMLATPPVGSAPSLGMIVLASRLSVRQFNEEDLELLVSLASVAALRIGNALLAEEAAERQRFEEELKLARSIQVALLTEELPALDGWQLHAGNVPSRRVSGDFYKIVERETGGQRELVVLLADVSGKGMAASLLTAALEAMTSGLLEETGPPDAICHKVNRLLYQRTPPAKYATGFLALIDPVTGELRYTSAGHNPVLLVRAGGTVEELESTGQPLGLLPSPRFETAGNRLEPGDLLVAYSDGITEATDAAGREYGVERLQQACTTHRTDPLDELADQIEQDLRRFVGDEPFADDRTIVMVRRVG